MLPPLGETGDSDGLGGGGQGEGGQGVEGVMEQGVISRESREQMTGGRKRRTVSREQRAEAWTLKGDLLVG